VSLSGGTWKGFGGCERKKDHSLIEAAQVQQYCGHSCSTTRCQGPFPLIAHFEIASSFRVLCCFHQISNKFLANSGVHQILNHYGGIGISNNNATSNTDLR
jgi:hypothetical protein